MRIVMAEDEALMSHGLYLLLTRAGFDVVAMASDGDSLLEETARHEPDLVLTDIRMPPDFSDEGLRAALQIKRDRPAVGVIVLSHHVQRGNAVELFGAHAAGVGYLLKQRVTNVEAFTRDLRTVAEGGTALDPEVVTMLLARARTTTGGDLTERQERVLELMARGHSNSAIARELCLTEKSVVHHVSHIYELLGLPVTPDVHRRVQAVVRHLWG